MGIIGDQPLRTDYVEIERKFIDDRINAAKALAKGHGISLQDVLAVQTIASRNAMLSTIQEDEHAGGYADRIAGVESAMRGIAEAIETLAGNMAVIADVLESKL